MRELRLSNRYPFTTDGGWGLSLYLSGRCYYLGAVQAVAVAVLLIVLRIAFLFQPRSSPTHVEKQTRSLAFTALPLPQPWQLHSGL